MQGVCQGPRGSTGKGVEAKDAGHVRFSPYDRNQTYFSEPC